jgi:hypothetical protein
MLEKVSFNKKKQNIKIRNKLLRNLPKLNAELNEAYKKMKRNVKTFLNKRKLSFTMRYCETYHFKVSDP